MRSIPRVSDRSHWRAKRSGRRNAARSSHSPRGGLHVESLETRVMMFGDSPIQVGEVGGEGDVGRGPDSGIVDLPYPDVVCRQIQQTADASFDWEALPRFGQDGNGNDRIDVPNTYEHVHAEHQRVRISGVTCGRHQWTIDGLAVDPPDGSPHVLFADLAPGLHTVAHTHHANDGTQETLTRQIEVQRDLLFVSIGDSAASGEGNPEVRQKFDALGFVASGPTWADSPSARVCHRSTLAGPAQAALSLEEADPHQSVTFVSVACTGASIERGLLGEHLPSHPGYFPDPDWADDVQPAQLEQVRELTCDDPDAVADDGKPDVSTCRNIDALTISIGVNDLQFSTIARRLVMSSGNSMEQLDMEVRAYLALLEKNFDEKLVPALDPADRPLIRVEPQKIYITEYPDILHDENGQFCDTILDDIAPGFTIDAEEAQWAHENVVQPLNDILRSVAAANEWNFVSGIHDTSHGHGYCAAEGERWVRTADESRRFQGPYHHPALGAISGAVLSAHLGPLAPIVGALGGAETVKRFDRIVTMGTLHPNERGHEEIGRHLFEWIEEDLVQTSIDLSAIDLTAIDLSWLKANELNEMFSTPEDEIPVEIAPPLAPTTLAPIDLPTLAEGYRVAPAGHGARQESLPQEGIQPALDEFFADGLSNMTSP